ncbi:hypothetical protein JTB14_005746 [Gonioctena quinquepunctata]|nr:hypothetical protein JTB14_005746 [Gonioctena quinquepunctata]
MINFFENVLSKTQPDDKQSEYRSSRFSVAFHILLPVAGLTLLLFGKKQLFTKLMLQLDRNCVSVLCPSLSKREKLLKWACNRLPSTWSSSTTTTLSGGVAELWKDGSLLCTLLNTAIPGACPNPHRHWNQPLTHAQAIVYKYLGVASVFTDEDLSESLSSNLESKFINYLNDIQQSMEKLSESSEKEKKVTSLYIARGMGLFSGEQHKKAEFYIYPNDKTDDEKRNVIIQIKGPYGTFGEAMIPEFREKLLKIPEINIISDLVESSQFLKPHPKSDFMEKFSKYFKKYHVKHLGENIVLDVIMEEERAKVTYIPKHYGMYEINLISDGELIKGCPFNVHIFSNDSVEETFDHDDKYEETRPYRRRKVISQTIDLIDEEIPLSEFEEKYQAPEPVTVKEDSPEKSNLNFREVVEELTKNSETIRKKLEGDNHQVESEVKQPILMEEVDEPDSVYLENRSESLPPKPPFPEIDHISSVGMET